MLDNRSGRSNGDKLDYTSSVVDNMTDKMGFVYDRPLTGQNTRIFHQKDRYLLMDDLKYDCPLSLFRPPKTDFKRETKC